MFKKLSIGKRFHVILTDERIRRRSKSDREREQKRLAEKKLKNTLLAERGECCELCGDEHLLDMHHINPFSMGGANSKSNTMIVCKSCHNKLHNNPIYALAVYHSRGAAYSLMLMQDQANKMLNEKSKYNGR